MAASGLSCGKWDLRCVALASLVVALGLFSNCGTWALERMGSVVVARGLSCPVACGILVPQAAIEPASPALEGGFLTTGPPGSPCNVIIKYVININTLPRTVFELEFRSFDV